MVRRFSVSPKIADLKGLAVIAISLGIFISITTPVCAESGTRVAVMQARVQSNIRIAQECLNRKEYMKADGFLQALGGQGDLVGYLSGSQKVTVARLKNAVESALAGRTEIAQRLKKSDELAKEGRHIEAKQQLLAVRDSEYLKEKERKWIVESLGAFGSDVVVVASVGPQAVPVAQVEAAKVDASEAVALRAVAPRAVVPTAVAPRVVAPKSVIPAAVDSKALSRTAVGGAVADKQKAEDSYIKVVARERNVLRSYTKAVVDDSVAKATKFRDDQAYDQADISLDAAFFTVDKNKMLLGDALYGEYLSHLTNLRNDIGAKRNADIIAKEKQARDDGKELADKLRRDMELRRLLDARLHFLL